MKQGLFSQLGCENPEQIKNAGLCLAVIASVELPQNQWPDFLDMMAGSAQSALEIHRFASVSTIQQLVDIIEDDTHILEEDQINKLLQCSVLNILPNF
jgi:hypothetical protein